MANTALVDHLGRALASLRHRGPDGEGSFVSGQFGLAHARLSIIDLSEGAKQPMIDPTGRFVLVFNGEIYNYRELAAAYLADCSSLNRASDTAVLLAMYVRFGRTCLQYLDGMFAFAVVDLIEKKIFLARDRFGEKPLYWIKEKGFIAFASELGALRALLPAHEWRIDNRGLLLYHALGSIPPPFTIYMGLQAVRPGWWMEFSADGTVKEGSYWTLVPERLQVKTQADAIEGCRALLQRAVASRLVSDVQVGLFLSGGLDSGSLASLSVSQGASLNALCLDFEERSFSEFDLAGQTSRRFGLEVHRATITRTEFARNLDLFFLAADQPTTDGFNTFFVAQHARLLGIKVWLSGVGGDELFGGYPSFRRLGRLSALSSALKRALPSGAGRSFATYFPHRLRWGRIANLGRGGDPATLAYQCLRNTTPVCTVVNTVSPAMRMGHGEALELIDSVYPSTAYCTDDFQRATLLESQVYMASQLLRDIDNFSMVHSIEVRAPFLDHRLFGYVFSLARRFKQRGARSKPLLLDALPNSLPEAVAAQPKRGFTFPIERWLRNDLRTSFEALVFDSRNSAFWDLVAVRKLWQAYLTGRIHWSVPWQFYAFARWCAARHA